MRSTFVSLVWDDSVGGIKSQDEHTEFVLLEDDGEDNSEPEGVGGGGDTPSRWDGDLDVLVVEEYVGLGVSPHSPYVVKK